MVALFALGVIGIVAFATEAALGFGDTVLVTCLGAQLVPLTVTLPAFVPFSLVLSTYLMMRGRRAIAWRMLATELAPPVGAGAAVGLAIFHLPGQRWFLLAFALFVVALAAFELARARAHASDDEAAELPRGRRIFLYVVGGIAHGLFGTGGPLIVYVCKRRLTDKAAFRATLALVWIALDVALIANFASARLYGGAVPGAMIAIGAAIGPGLFIGERLHARLDPARFERVVWWLLLVAGAALAIRAALGLQ